MDTTGPYDEFTAEWLAEEMDDFMPTGLYEFVWSLNSHPTWTRAEKLEVANATLRILLDRPGYVLRWKWWASDVVPPNPVPDWPAERDWVEPREDEPYLELGLAND